MGLFCAQNIDTLHAIGVSRKVVNLLLCDFHKIALHFGMCAPVKPIAHARTRARQPSILVLLSKRRMLLTAPQARKVVLNDYCSKRGPYLLNH
jgi:hypothetical protein